MTRWPIVIKKKALYSCRLSWFWEVKSGSSGSGCGDVFEQVNYEYACPTSHKQRPDDKEITPIHFHSLSSAAWQYAWKDPSNDVNSWINTPGCLSFPCSKWRALHRSSWAGLVPHVQDLQCALYCHCWGTADVCPFSQMSPHAYHISPHLSNVLLIYTCWARSCIGIRCTLTASITQQDLLLPFKIHLKWLAGATVHPGMGAMILWRMFHEGGLVGDSWKCLSFFFCFCIVSISLSIKASS